MVFTRPLENPHPMSNFVSGRHFLQTPGPTNLPERVLRAMNRNAINHRGPEFGALGREIVEKLRTVLQTKVATIGIFPASGTGAWESALANTLSPGDRILISRTGQFSHLWEQMATHLGVDVVSLETDWRRGADPIAIQQALEQDREHKIKAVCAVHSETSTSCMTDIAAVRHAMTRAAHPALLMVDAISSLGCADYRHDEWDVDVTIAGSQKGLMVPPGLSFTAISDKALTAARAGGSRRSYWDWEPPPTRLAFSPTRPRSTCSTP
jgi:alanine-glyoxylate transaminase/serine-glyoxylate transaminase/serine-pyruvate transaminase